MTSRATLIHRDLVKRKSRARSRALSELANKYPEEYKEIRERLLAEEMVHHNMIFGISSVE